ncbi:hypothetical protein SAMN04488041_101249 [Sulfitobacter pontiacus]|uniref:Uncharacterized protein n=1 Tax=Sulfitobacter pontiacus TaxID=60137 RepID=A0A1H2QMJ0_9RHOB|nr:hypothetical protein [Sulfitobacter pontiacus]SDW08376.1 hypothetical protein SAMN04488041_101249 [Sulfitobacter pontiacus]
MKTFEQMHGDLISATSGLADTCLSPMSDVLLQHLSGMLAQVQEQLSAMQEAMPTGNAVHLDR